MDINIILQKNYMDYIVNQCGNECMVTIHSNDIFIRSYLIPIEHTDSELSSTERNMDSLMPGCSQIGDEIRYKKFNNELGYEPFIIERDFCGIQENILEVVEEFRLLFNLYFNKSSNSLNVVEDDEKVVAFSENGKVKVSTRYLRIYLALKNMTMVIFLENIVRFNEIYLYEEATKIIEENKIENTGEDYICNLCVSDYGTMIEGEKFFSMFRGKKLIFPVNSLQGCGVWPYEKHKEFIEFKIGVDSNGREICFSCNPDGLSNNFRLKENIPHYLTPVFFKREVLNKYYNDDRYSVEDGIVSCGNIWSLYIDNQDGEYVSAYLGDLGRDLPNKEEQCYWNSYNIVCDGSISEVKFRRDMLAQATEPSSIVFKFQNKYKEIVDKTYQELGWNLFLTLNKDDEYNLTSLRLPSNSSMFEFDSLVLSVTKIMIDSLNEKALKQCVGSLSNNIRGISLLEIFFKEKKVDGFGNHIEFLRNLQALRSSSVGHRKGSNYEKIARKFNINKNYNSVFESILNSSYEFLLFVENNLEVLK